jgi:hypothetical protein
MYVNIPDNKKIAMPRYYKDKIYNQLEKDKIAMYLKTLAEIEEEKIKQELGETYEKIIVERHIQQFNKMYKNAEIGRQYE